MLGEEAVDEELVWFTGEEDYERGMEKTAGRVFHSADTAFAWKRGKQSILWRRVCGGSGFLQGGYHRNNRSGKKF